MIIISFLGCNLCIFIAFSLKMLCQNLVFLIGLSPRKNWSRDQQLCLLPETILHIGMSPEMRRFLAWSRGMTQLQPLCTEQRRRDTMQ